MARFARQKKNKVSEPVQTSRDIIPSQATAYPETNLNVTTEIHTVLDTPHQPTYTPGNTSNCSGHGLEVAEHTHTTIGDASTDLIGDDTTPTTIFFTANIGTQPDKATSPSSKISDEEFDGGKSSTNQSCGSASTTRTSESSDSYLNRSDWEPLRALPHSNFHKILSQHVGGSIETAENDYQYCEEFEGGYNYIRIYNVLTGSNAGAYVVKIPSVGTALRWQKQDGYMLRSEFGTINFIRERTKCPVPEVIAYADTLNNDLGAPFILMKACTGVRAVEIWHGADADGRWDPDEVDFPSATLFAKRSRMLRSLAQAMAELQNLEFDKIGALDFGNVETNGMPAVGPVWLWELDPYCPADMFTEKALSEKPVYDSSLELLMDGLEEVWPHQGKEGRLMVIHQILDTIYRSDAFSKPTKPGCSKETFVLRHDDLNLQNIFCDPDTGEVTAIIDWERASTTSHCLGYSSLPLFLTSDWGPGYDVYDASHSPLSLQAYREIYADAMIKATGSDGDGRYTYKSAMYQAAYAALFGSHVGGNVGDFVRKLLHEVPGLHHTDLELYLTWLGEHWEAVGSSVKQAIRKVAKPVAWTIDYDHET
jgi:hypothetical protein